MLLTNFQSRVLNASLLVLAKDQRHSAHVKLTSCAFLNNIDLNTLPNKQVVTSKFALITIKVHMIFEKIMCTSLLCLLPKNMLLISYLLILENYVASLYRLLPHINSHLCVGPCQLPINTQSLLHQKVETLSFICHRSNVFI